MRFEKHWRFAIWALFDKSLVVVFGLAFMLLVVRTLPAEEFGLQAIASTVLLTLAPLLRATLLVPLTKYVAEGRDEARVAATGAVLYVGACAILALALTLGRSLWAGMFGKPALAAVLVPTSVLLLVGSARDIAVATLEGQRRLPRLFLMDLAYYSLAIGALAWWRSSAAPRDAATVQWVQAAAAGMGSVLGILGISRTLWALPSRTDALRILRFGRYSFGSGLGTTLGQQADSLLAGALMNERGVASYQVAKLFFRVFNVVAQAINQVIMPLVSRLHADDRWRDLRVLFEKGSCFLHLGLIPIIVGLILLAQPIYALFYGEAYADSIPVFRILVASALTLPFASMGAPFLTGMGRVRTLLWATWLGTIVAVLSAWLWIPRYGPVGAALAQTFGKVVVMLSLTWVLRSLLGFRLRDVLARTRDASEFLRRKLGST